LVELYQERDGVSVSEKTVRSTYDRVFGQGRRPARHRLITDDMLPALEAGLRARGFPVGGAALVG
jgi:hypothetical protein